VSGFFQCFVEHLLYLEPSHGKMINNNEWRPKDDESKLSGGVLGDYIVARSGGISWPSSSFSLFPASLIVFLSIIGLCPN